MASLVEPLLEHGHGHSSHAGGDGGHGHDHGHGRGRGEQAAPGGNSAHAEPAHSSDDEARGHDDHGHGGHGHGHGHGHSHSHAVLDADSAESIAALSVYEIGRRIGTLHDLWRTDPARAMKMFTSDTPKEHVLRGLFLPLPKDFSPPMVDASLPKNVDQRGPPYEVGEYVYAPLGPFEIKGPERKAMKDMHADDTKRIWYLCKVVSSDKETCTLSCTDLANYKSKPVNFTRRHEELLYAGTRESCSVLDHIAHKAGKPPLKLTLFQKAQFFGLVVLGIAFLQVYASAFLDPFCEEQDPAHPHCQARSSLRQGLATVIGVISLAISVCTYWLLLPAMYRIAHGVNSLMAMRARQLLVSLLLDPLILKQLPNVAGRGEEFVVVAYAAIVMSFTIFAFCLGDVGVLAFGALVGQKFLMAGNMLGVKKSFLVLRERQLFEVAEEIRKKCPVSISKEQLELEMKLFLAHDADNETMQISRDLMLLIAIGMKVENPDTIRLRYLVVPDVYVSNYFDKPGVVPKNFERSDVMIDLFANSVEVPGVVLNPEVDRWLQHGSKFFWHTCMKQDQVTQCELDLRSLGMQGGDGCFTWRPNVAHKWAALECRYDREHIHRVARISERRQDLCSSLYAMAIAGRGMECRALLDAQADPNHRDASGVPVMVAACSYKHDDTHEIVEMLLERRADPSAVSCDSGQSSLMTLCRKGRVRMAKMLLEAGADVNHVAANGCTALSWAQKADTFKEVGEERKAKSRELVQLLVSYGAKTGTEKEGAQVEDEAPVAKRRAARKRTLEEVECMAAEEQVDDATDVDEDHPDGKAKQSPEFQTSSVVEDMSLQSPSGMAHGAVAVTVRTADPDEAE